MASTSLTRTPSSATNRKTFTISMWVKRAELSTQQCLFSVGNGSSNPLNFFGFYLDKFVYWEYSNSTTGLSDLQSNLVLRDPSAWYHLVASIDTTQATASDRIKLYVNGTQVTSFSSSSYPSQNQDLGFNNTQPHDIGRYLYTGTSYYGGEMAHFHFIDGTAYAPTDFAETDSTSGVWKPKTQPSVTYGTNGFFLKFANSASLGTDSSGNGNNFTVNGSGTQTLDTPSNVYATWNPLIYMPNKPTFENGNLYVKGHDANYGEAISTLSMAKSGKWYAEFKKIEVNNCFMVGVGNTQNLIEALRTNTNISPSGGGYSGGAVTIRDGGDVRQTNVSDISGFFSSSIANGDIIGIALDLDNGAVYAHKNGTYGVISSVTGDPTSGASKTGAIDISGQSWYQNADFLCFLFGNTSGAIKDWCQANFGNGYFGTTAISSPNSDGAGEGKFAYTVPTGYYTLNTKNLKTYG